MQWNAVKQRYIFIEYNLGLNYYYIKIENPVINYRYFIPFQSPYSLYQVKAKMRP